MFREVAITDCVHHCGFRYGRDEFNPYENYITGLAANRPMSELREHFVDFIRHYRPRDIGEALGITTSHSIPLWLLPWKSWLKLLQPGGWLDSPEDVPDILTYFSPVGIHWHRIEEEFGWLERAWHTMRNHHYRPKQFGYIEVFELRGDTFSRFVVLDGNHRLAALHALGQKRVLVRQRRFYRATRRHARLWPLVLSGHVPYHDALAIFDGYIQGNASPFRAAIPATIIN